MTETERFVHRAEQDLRGSGALGEAALAAWDGLPPADRAAFAPALDFLRRTPGGGPGWAGSTPEADRIAASRLMLVKLGLPGGDPSWSSHLLETMVDAVLATPGGGLGDLFTAFYELLGECPLSGVVANLIKDLVVLGFMRHRSSYDAISWAGLLRGDARGLTEARSHLLALALPPGWFSTELADAVSRALEATPWAVAPASLLP